MCLLVARKNLSAGCVVKQDGRRRVCTDSSFPRVSDPSGLHRFKIVLWFHQRCVRFGAKWFNLCLRGTLAVLIFSWKLPVLPIGLYRYLEVFYITIGLFMVPIGISCNINSGVPASIEINTVVYSKLHVHRHLLCW